MVFAIIMISIIVIVHHLFTDPLYMLHGREGLGSIPVSVIVLVFGTGLLISVSSFFIPVDGRFVTTQGRVTAAEGRATDLFAVQGRPSCTCAPDHGGRHDHQQLPGVVPFVGKAVEANN